MSFELYKNLINQIKVPLTVSHFGVGEPLLHRDIVEMIRYASRKGMETILITNGTLLTPEMSDNLFRAGLGRLGISVDAAHGETFSRIRPGGNLQTVFNNIESAVQIRNGCKTRKTRIYILVVPMKSNLGELPELARKAIELGVDDIELNRFAKAKASKRDDEAIVARINSEDPYAPDLDGERARAFRELEEISKKTGFPITKPPLNADALYRPPRRCPMPFTYPLVTWEGYVTPCFCIIDPQQLPMGDLNKKPFYVIWNGKPFREFRGALLSPSPHPNCRTCEIFHGISQLWQDYREIS
jgi:radical SAM protein with 4Fe4S-binding SPASM domain